MSVSIVDHSTINCNDKGGCSAFYQASEFSMAADARREARAHAPRHGYCPAHAPRNGKQANRG